MKRRRRAVRRWPMLAAVILFLASRLYLLFGFVPRESDIPWVYHPYVLEHEQAVSEGRSLYAFHAEQFERASERAAGQARRGPREEMHWIEYPPLALRFVLLPKLFLERVPLRPLEEWPPAGDVPGYAHVFRTLMAVVDAVGFVVVLFFVRRMFPRESPARHFERYLIYVIGGLALAHLLYDRLSLPVGVLVLLGTGLLMDRRRPALAGLLALAVAVNYQISPLVLLPVVTLGVVPLAALGRASGPLVAALGTRTLVFLALTMGLFLPFYLYEGPASLGLFAFHGQRGLATEAVLATVPLVLSFFGQKVEPIGAYNCWNLASPTTPALVTLSTPIVLTLVSAVAGALLIRMRRRASTLPERLASSAGPAYAGFVLASFAVAIAGSKVFSPQYLLWLLPLVPLLPGRTAPWSFVLVAVVTTLIFPYAYDHVSRWYQDPTTQAWMAVGPTTTGKVLLTVRNFLFVTFAALAFRSSVLALDLQGR